MSPRPIAGGDPHYLVPLVLLSAVCVVASFSSVLYAIAARTHVDGLSARLAVLESRCRCDNPSEVANIAHDQGSEEIGNDIPSGEGSPESADIRPFKRNSNLAGSEIIASHVHSLHPARETYKEIIPSTILHPPGEWEKRTSKTTNNDQVVGDDVTTRQDAPKQPATHISETKKLIKRSTSSNREFLNEDEVEDVSRADRRRGSRRRGGVREDAPLRGGHRMTGSTQQPLALHFDGDASKYSLSHRHYEGNGRLRHPDGILKDWQMKDWGGRFDRQHRLHENDGTLTIREPGIYFVYAQVYYLDDHDINGFRILVNDSPVFQCTTMTHGEPLTKANTCFTGGMVELHAGDIILLRDLAALRYSVFEPGKSFFGLFRVAHHTSGGREGP